MKVRWEGDNLREIEMALSHHHAEVEKISQTDLRITGPDGLSVEVNLGDYVILRGDSLGIERPPNPGPDPEIMWTGDNAAEVVKFIEGWSMTPSVVGSAMMLTVDGQEPHVLQRGDKLIKKGTGMFVSRVGSGHRA